LQATALVHEAYLRLVGSPTEATVPAWNSRGHFFAAAAEAMRRILVDQARHKHSIKAGGDRRRIELSAIEPAVPETDAQLLALHDAIDRLEAADKRRAELVKLRFFVGLTVEEAAHLLGVSISTATADWAYARAWLRLEVLGVGDLKAT
jgi:RNA polymerase sigma factor (TIGR02999 family)